MSEVSACISVKCAEITVYSKHWDLTNYCNDMLSLFIQRGKLSGEYSTFSLCLGHYWVCLVNFSCMAYVKVLESFSFAGQYKSIEVIELQRMPCCKSTPSQITVSCVVMCIALCTVVVTLTGLLSLLVIPGILECMSFYLGSMMLNVTDVPLNASQFQLDSNTTDHHYDICKSITIAMLFIYCFCGVQLIPIFVGCVCLFRCIRKYWKKKKREQLLRTYPN